MERQWPGLRRREGVPPRRHHLREGVLPLRYRFVCLPLLLTRNALSSSAIPGENRVARLAGVEDLAGVGAGAGVLAQLGGLTRRKINILLASATKSKS